MDVEQQVRETYVERLGALELSGGDVGAARRTGARLRARRRLAVGAAALAVGAVAVGGTLLGTGRVSVGPSHSVGHWRELPTPPLSPRADALSVWTGREVVVVGGDPDPCPPNADCATAPRELRDGAAYDPATDAWHRIAPAPVTVGPGDRLLSAAGRVVLRHWQEHGSRLFVYDPAGDEWSEIPTLLADLPSAVGQRVYGFRDGRVTMYDAERGVWDERIPRDRIQPRLTQRRITATSSGPVVTGVPANVPRDGSVPPVVAADLYDGTTWHRLPTTGQVGNNAWFWTGTRLVDPEPGTLDGGETDSWGRSYPQGGILDPATGSWSPLPSGLTDHGNGWTVNASGGRWVATYGQVYDTGSGRVWELPRPDDTPDLATTAVWTDRALLVFGGVDSAQGYSGDALTNHAWLYTP